MNELLALIKRAALEVVDNAAPCAVLFGTVEGVSPLQISVEQRFSLGEKQLVPSSLTGTLENGDGVVLLRIQGGQQFVVLDRIGGMG